MIFKPWVYRSTLNLITWNVRGIRARPKRTGILNHLIKLKLQSQQFNQVFSATYNSRQRGVCILVNKRIPLIHHSTITDPDGRYIIMGYLRDLACTRILMSLNMKVSLLYLCLCGWDS
uniref:Uncharacterized protein n=1 Tax=Sparus aurata TaxID=8175 RepID=A0A671XQU5_SPAAU